MCQDIEILYNSQDIFYKNPFGAIPSEKLLNIKIKINSNKPIDFIKLHLCCDALAPFKEELKNKRDFNMQPIFSNNECSFVYSCSFIPSLCPCLLFYYFEISIEGTSIYYGNNKVSLGGVGEVYAKDPIPYQLTVYHKDLKTPAWIKGAIGYQIFVDRFYNGNEDFKVSNPKKNSFIYGNWNDTPMYIRDKDTNEILRWDFFGGNLKGIIKKLDYLQSLGVTFLYLNPIFESRSNHKYDTGDFKKIDPMYGDEEILKELVEKAKERDIKIILDGVFNHVGSNSVYFNKYNTYDSIGAYNSKTSPYYSWFTFKKYPNDYASWWGVTDLPSINELTPSYMDYIIYDEDSVINHWMKLGISGWRLDVADELPDKFLEELKLCCEKNNGDSILLGEVWEDASNKISYNERKKYFIHKELDSVTNYPFRKNLLDFIEGKISSKHLTKLFMSMYENYPLHNFYALVNLLGSHDVERVYTLLKELCINKKLKGRELDFLKLLSLVQFTMPGAPLIYYGDETCVEGLRDPYNRATYPFGFENQELISWYRLLGNLRKKYLSLSTSYFIPLSLSEPDVFAYLRCSIRGEDVFKNPMEDFFSIIIINRSTKSFTINLDLRDYLQGSKLPLKNAFKAESLFIIDGKLEINLSSLEGKFLYIEL